MKIIVLGASGQIGSLLYDRLRQDHDVTGTSRRRSNKYLQLDPFKDDWSALGKADVLVNCVGQIEATLSTSFYKIHVELAKLIIKYRELIGNPKIIQVSALGASINHKVEFLRTKGIADDFLLQHTDTVVVRPSIVCTHRTMIVRKMLMLEKMTSYTLGVVVVPRGFLHTRIQPVMPGDLAVVVEKLCLHPQRSKVIHVVGPDPFSFHELLRIMFEAKGKKYRLLGVPKFITDVIIGYGVSLLFPKAINPQQYQLLFEDNVADSTEAERMLGIRMASTREYFINEFSNAHH